MAEVVDEGTLSTEDAFLEAHRKMFEIVSMMRKFPEPPSEIPQDKESLLRVEFPDKGGILTYMGNHKYPFQGFPYHEFVDKIDLMKKMGRGALSSLFHSIKVKPWMLITLIPSAWFFRDAFRAGVHSAHRVVSRFLIKPELYSPMVRELHFSFGNASGFREELRDVICMFLEFDNAYRFRMNDVFCELNQEDMKNPIKTINKILSIMSSREKTQEIKDTWFLMKLLVGLYVPFDKELNKILKDTFSSIDVRNMRMNEMDKEWCEKRTDYAFGFKQ